MANMTFKTNLLPQVSSGSTTSTYTLGDSTHKWENIFGNLTGNADSATVASRLNITTTDNAIARFDGANGTIQNSGVLINDTNDLTTEGNFYSKGYYVSNCNAASTSQYQFGFYQWDNEFQFTYRNSSNTYLGQAFGIDGATGKSRWSKDATYDSGVNIYPVTNNTDSVGLSDHKFANMYATTFHGALDGNASTATALGSNAGSTTQPIYFSGGKPAACGTSLAVSITGNAATATKVNQTLTAGSKTYDGSAAVTITAADIGAATSSHSHSYLPLSGGTMSGSINMATTPGTCITGINGTAASSVGYMYTTAGIQIRENGLVGSSQSDIKYAPTLGFHWAGRVAGNLSLHSDGAFYFYNNSGNLAAVKAGAVWGAVWNDYAEFREGDTIESGKCVIEVGDDTLITSTERMMPGANITSDTFGFAIGETEQAKTPVAVSGRVLAYPYESREEFKKNIGRPVCSGPNGTVSIMTDEEYRNKGYCAVGTISAVPDYEEWGTGKVKVNGRVWIKVK